MKSLQTLCEISLMRNHSNIQSVSNVPYHLLKRILQKVKIPQLLKLEKSNVLLIFDDDELWLEFLRQDFPTNVHEQFVSKSASISRQRHPKQQVPNTIQNVILKVPTRSGKETRGKRREIKAGNAEVAARKRKKANHSG